MKKFNFSKFLHAENLFKFDLRMRLTTLLLIVSIFQIQATDSYSQNTKITLKLDDVTIEDVFKNIEAQSEFTFLFNHKKIDVDRKVSLDFTKTRISEILESLFLKTNIYFKVRKKQIILKTGKKKKPVPIIEVSETQQSTINGKITDANGVPLPGVNILVIGTNTGTQTDFDGNYTIEANDGDVLRFTYVGYKGVDLTVGTQANYNFPLVEDTAELDEVVVVGYNSIIKKKITSSVATIDTEDLQEVPATTLGGAIAGRLAGVTITTSGGRPGRAAAINVRGATTGAFAGGSAPLYVIDGIISNKEQFDNLDVNEVDAVTVLKDAASTSAYGARASNGVILVTTKTGEGKPKINFTTSIGTTSPAVKPDFTTAYEHTQLINSSILWNNQDPASNANYTTPEEQEYLRSLGDRSFLSDFERTPVLKRHAISVSGSAKSVNYFLSGSLIDEDAAFDNLEYDKLNLRAKVGVDISEDLNISMNISTSKDEDLGFFWRWNGGDEDFGDFYRTASRGGHWGPSINNGLFVANFNGWNAGNLIDNGAGYQTRESRITNTLLKLDYKIPFLEGLSAGLSYNSNVRRGQNFLFRQSLIDYTFAADPNNRFILTDEVIGTRVRNDSGADSNSVQEDTSLAESYQLNARIDYSNTFGNHSVNVYGVYEQWELDSRFFGAIGRNYPTDLVPTLNATASDDERAFGALSEEGRQSIIGGLNYSFKDKYLLTYSFRYDGSVRFAEGRRFGYFPALSLGWIVSDEDFFADNLSFLDFLKLRFSVGKTGNDDVGAGFPYIQRYNLGTGAVLGTNDIITSSVSIGAQPSPLITWEEQTTYNYGIDFKAFNNRLSTSIDIFKNEKRGLFGSRQLFIPESSGLTLNPENYGGIDITGFEVLSSYNTQVTEDLSLEAGFNVGYSKGVYANIDEPESTLPRFNRNGKRIDRIQTFIADRIIRTQEDLDAILASGFTQFGRAPRIGEILYRDIRGNRDDDPNQNTPDGIIDGWDSDFISGARNNAPINYGIRLNLRYKNFSLFAFAQGLAGHQRMVPDNGRFTFANIGESAWSDWNDSWTPDNPNAAYPVFGGDEGWRYRASTFWLKDADFLRVKNLNLSYDVPKDVIGKVGISRVNIFLNATNPFMIYSKIKNFDPETNGQGIPVNRSYSLGLNLTF